MGKFSADDIISWKIGFGISCNSHEIPKPVSLEIKRKESI